MAGTAGSKYGIINDGIPLRSDKGDNHSDFSSLDIHHPKIDLKDLRSLINARLKHNWPAQTKP